MPLKRLAELRVHHARMKPGALLTLDVVESGTGHLVSRALPEADLPPDVGVADAEPGDVLFGKLRPYLAKVLLVEEPSYASTELMCLRPFNDVDSRWLKYVLLSQPVIQRSVATSEGTKMPRTSWERLGIVQVRSADLEEQRAIADFLDAETARIDALIATKTELKGLLEERRAVLLENVLLERGVDLHDCVTQSSTKALPDHWAVLTLGRVLRQLTNGYVGPTRDILVEHGIRYIQGLHIKRDRIDFDRRRFYVPQEWHRGRPRISLQAGDVVIVQTGDIGQVAVVPADFGPASCHALLIARPNPELISSEFLGVYLQSTIGRNELLRLATGALHPHLEFGVRAAPVLVPPQDQQVAIVEEVQDGRKAIDDIQARLSRQLALLQERRQALITAAVTGQVNIPGLAA